MLFTLLQTFSHFLHICAYSQVLLSGYFCAISDFRAHRKHKKKKKSAYKQARAHRLLLPPPRFKSHGETPRDDFIWFYFPPLWVIFELTFFQWCSNTTSASTAIKVSESALHFIPKHFSTLRMPSELLVEAVQYFSLFICSLTRNQRQNGWLSLTDAWTRRPGSWFPLVKPPHCRQTSNAPNQQWSGIKRGHHSTSRACRLHACTLSGQFFFLRQCTLFVSKNSHIAPHSIL